MSDPAQTGRWPRRLAAGLVLALAGLNLVAWLHAGAMLSWAEGPARTAAPEQLGLAAKLRVLAAGVSVPRPRSVLTPIAYGLEYETHRIPNGRGDELDAWFIPGAGEEVVALLFPGYASSKDSMLPHALALLDLGAGVLLVDYYGVGDSSGTGTSLGILESGDVAAATAHARATWPWAELVLYGRSMGGAAVLRAVALEGAAPDAIVLESCFDRLLSTVGARFHRMGLPAAPFAQLLVFWGGVRLGANGFEHDPVAFAASVTCPALVLQSAEDPNISHTQARSIHGALGGWKRYSESSAAGHGQLLAAAPERWRAEVTALLEQLGGW